MRALILRIGQILLLLIALSIQAADASAQQRFWVGGSGQWQDPFRWASSEGGLPGAGPPGATTFAEIIDDAASPRTIVFTEDGAARQLLLELTNAQYDFDLNGFTLDIGLNLYLDALSNVTNRFSVDGGRLEVRTLSATTAPLGIAEMVLGPSVDVQLFPNADSPGGFVQSAELNANGQGASILIEGSVRLNQSAIGPELPFIAINDGGQVDVVGGSLFNEGSLHVGATVAFEDPTTTGQLDVTGGGVLDNTTEALVGREGSGTLQVLDGSSFVSRGVTTLGADASGSGYVLVQSAGNLSQWFAFDQITVGDAGSGTLSIGGNGLVQISQPGANVHVGEQVDGDGLLFVQEQGFFDTVNSVFVGGSATAAGGRGDFVVMPTGTATVAGQIKVWGQGTLAAEGGDVTAGQIRTTSGSTLRVVDTGSIETPFLELAAGTNLDLVGGELAVVGPGATFLAGNQSIAFGSTTGQPTIRLQDVIAFVNAWQLGIGSGDDARTVVTGGQASLNASTSLRVGGGIGAASGTLEVLDGGTASAGDDVILADGLGSTGTAVVQGVSGGGDRSLLRKNFGPAPEELVVGRRGVGSLSVLDGGLVQSLSSMSLGSRADGDGSVTVSGSSGSIPSELSVSQDLAIAGSASNVGPGGTGLLKVESAGSVLVGDLTTLYGGGTADVQAGARLTTNRLHLLGGALQNDGIIDVGGTTSTAADGELIVADGGELVVDGGAHRFGSLRLEPGSTFDFRDGSLNAAGGSLGLNATSFAYGSSSGLTTIELSEGALGEVTFFWRVGDEAGTSGLTVVRDPGSRLASTGGGATADFFVGYSGSGFLEIHDGGEVDFDDDVVLGERTGSLGSALVRGKVGTQRSRLVAGEGIGSVLIVGLQGDGDLTVADGALASAGDDVFVGWTSQGSGLVTVTGAAADGTLATLSANGDLLVGANDSSPPVDRGIGTILVHEGGEVLVADLTVVGPGDKISLLGGNLRTGRLDLAGDPGRLDWQSGTLDLTASGLVINATGLLGSSLTLATDKTLRADGAIQIFDEGVLNLAGGAAISNDLFSVEDGSILRGEGTIQSDLGAAIEGRIMPGNSAGTLNVVGDLRMFQTTETTIEIGGLVAGSEHDQIVVDGDLILDGGLTVSLIDGFVLETGQFFLIADVAATLTGTFFGLADDALVGTFGGVDLFIDYGAGDGNDLALYTSGGNPVSAPSVPTSFQLRVAPNPFNPATTVALELPRRAEVKVDVYDVRGAHVRRLLAHELEAGQHQLRFDGTDENGRLLASGVYFARVRVDGREHLHKLTLVK